MASIALVFHIEPGMTPKCLEFAEEAMGPRMAEHDESRRRLGITSEKVWLEPTNAGDMMIFYIESDDVEKALKMMGEAEHVYDLWFRDKMYELTAADLCDYRTVSSAETVFESPRLEPTEPGAPVSSVATVFPILPGKRDEWQALLESLRGPRDKEYRDYLSRYGLIREMFFVEPTSMGDMVILYAEGKDPAVAIADFARSSHPFDAWLREEMLQVNGIDFIRRRTAPAPHAIMDWKGEAKPMAA